MQRPAADQLLSAHQPNGRPLRLNLNLYLNLKVRQHPFGVIARRAGLVHDDLALGEEAGEQDGRFDLRARDRHGVINPMQVPAPDRQRRQLAILAAEHGRAHQPQRLGHAAHRPAAQRLAAGQHAGERLARQDARDEPDRRAGAGAVQHISRLAQAARAHAVDGQPAFVVLIDLHTQRPHAAERRLAHVGVHPAVDGGVALGQRAQQQRPVADRFVTRHRHRAAQRAGGVDNESLHGCISQGETSNE